MLVPMTKVRLLGARREVERVVDELHQLGLVEIADARASLAGEELGGDEERARRRERLRRLAAQTDGLLSLIAGDATRRDAAQDPLGRPLDLVALEAEVKPILSGVEASGNRLSALRDERLELPRFLEPLRRLLPLVPELADLDDEELGALRLDTVALVLNTDDEQLVLALPSSSPRSSEPASSSSGPASERAVWVACVVFPQQERRAVHALLGQAQVREAELPDAFKRLSLRAAVEAMQRRLAALPDLDRRRRTRARSGTAARMVRGSASCARRSPTSSNGLTHSTGSAATKRTFVAECWVPRRGLARLRREVEARLGDAVLVEDLATSRSDPQAPLLMRNVRAARPFEPLVGFLELPRAGSVDPTPLMALFLPMMLGVMIGDVGYGVVLTALALVARRRLTGRARRLPASLGSRWRARRGRSSSASSTASSSAISASDWSVTLRCGNTGRQPTRSSRCCCSPS